MHPVLRRVITAMVLLGGFIPALFWAPAWLWAALVSGVVVAAAYEWARLSLFPGAFGAVYSGLLGLISLSLPYLPDVDPTAIQYGLMIVAAVFWVAIAPLWLSRRWRGFGYLRRAAVGMIVLLPTWAALLYLRERGPWILLAVLAVVWIADTAAFFSGRRFGWYKLAPAISPGKTWEGVAGAMAALLLYASAVSAAVHGLRIMGALLMAMTLLYFSVLGDLFESWIKRVADRKDSGTLLPGHGGVLDRVDALTAALPIAAGLLMLVDARVEIF